MMAKTATKTKKVVSKSAKGKGKPAKAKVVAKKAAPKKAVKKATPKKVVKKAVAKKPAVKKVKIVDPLSYGKFYITPIGTESMPELVMITKAPKAYEGFIGKKYISRTKCITTIEAVKAGDSIDKGAKSIAKELDALGIAPMDTPETEDK
jgi:ribosome-binding factor A